MHLSASMIVNLSHTVFQNIFRRSNNNRDKLIENYIKGSLYFITRLGENPYIRRQIQCIMACSIFVHTKVWPMLLKKQQNYNIYSRLEHQYSPNIDLKIQWIVKKNNCLVVKNTRKWSRDSWCSIYHYKMISKIYLNCYI